MHLFANPVTYKEIVSVSDCQLLQDDLSHLYDWTVAW